MADFTIGERNYRSAQINAFTQLKIVKRLAPLFPYMKAFISVFDKGELKGPDDRDGATRNLMAMAQPISEALQKLPEDDFEYIVNQCLAVTMIQEQNVYVPITRQGQIMYQNEITAVGILMITVNVLVDNVASFSAALGNVNGVQPPGALTSRE